MRLTRELTWKWLLAPCLGILCAACASSAPTSLPVLAELDVQPAAPAEQSADPSGQPGSLAEPGGSETANRTNKPPAAQHPVTGPGFVEDEAAFAAARAWLGEHHRVPEGAQAPDVRCESYDREHDRVAWRQYFGDVPTSAGGVVQFVATAAVSSTGKPAVLSPMAGSEKPLAGAADALAAWRQVAKNRNLELEQLAAREEVTLLAAPRLHFVKSLRDEANPAGHTVWRPAWLLDESGKFGFDAHTGTPWYQFDVQELSAKPVVAWGVPADLVGPPMPLVRLVPLAPINNAAEFGEPSLGQYEYPKTPQPRGTTTEAPHPSAEQAIAAARSWVEQHFGALPEGVALFADDRSPQNPAVRVVGKGRNVMLRASWQGMPMDCYAAVAFEGKKVTHAYVALCKPEPIAGSARPTLTKQGAIDALLSQLAVDETPNDVVDRHLHAMQPRLEYVRSTRVDLDLTILAPNWSVVMNAPVFVDAHTGEVWRND